MFCVWTTLCDVVIFCVVSHRQCGARFACSLPQAFLPSCSPPPLRLTALVSTTSSNLLVTTAPGCCRPRRAYVLVQLQYIRPSLLTTIALGCRWPPARWLPSIFCRLRRALCRFAFPLLLFASQAFQFLFLFSVHVFHSSLHSFFRLCNTKPMFGTVGSSQAQDFFLAGLFAISGSSGVALGRFFGRFYNCVSNSFRQIVRRNSTGKLLSFP